MTYFFPPSMFVSDATPSFPSVVNRSAGTSVTMDVLNYNAPLPASLVSGNYLLMAIVASATAAHTGPSVSTPSGWTELFSDTASQRYHRLKVIGKTSAGNEGATVGLSIGSASRVLTTAMQVTGWGGAPSVSSGAFGSTSAANPPSSSPSWGTDYGTLFIPIAGMVGISAPSISAPSNYSNLNSQNSNIVVAENPFYPAVAMSERLLQASSEDPGNYSPSVYRWQSVTIAIRGA